MISKTATSLAFALACLTTGATMSAAQTQTAARGEATVVTNGPQSNVESMSPGWSARQNVIESQRYERLLATSPSFRQARMQKECGPISDPELHASCIASFNQY